MRHVRDVLCVLALGLAASMPAMASSWPELPLPDDSQGEWVSRHMIHNGVPMRAARFQSQLPPAQLVRYYEQLWPGQVTVTHLGSKKIVAHGTNKHFFTIEISGGAAGSEGQIGIVEVLKETPRAEPGADFLKPSGTQVVTDTVYLDNPGRTLTMNVRMSPFQADGFYKSRLPERGWRSQDAKPCPMMALSCTASYSNGKEQMTLTFNRNGETTDMVVNQISR